MRLTARNVLGGTVEKITHDTVVSEIQLRLDGGLKLVSVITRWSVDHLGLAVGQYAYAVIPGEDISIGNPQGGIYE